MLPVVCSILKDCCSNIFSLSFLSQTEIAKRLNAILAQIMPFLSQEVSVTAARSVFKDEGNFIHSCSEAVHRFVRVVSVQRLCQWDVQGKDEASYYSTRHAPTQICTDFKQLSVRLIVQMLNFSSTTPLNNIF